jgi:hypothetical protein
VSALFKSREEFKMNTIETYDIKNMVVKSMFWYGGKLLHALYGSKLPVISPWARKLLAAIGSFDYGGL